MSTAGDVSLLNILYFECVCCLFIPLKYVSHTLSMPPQPTAFDLTSMFSWDMSFFDHSVEKDYRTCIIFKFNM